jgi:lipopolysaccharide transport system permease protein
MTPVPQTLLRPRRGWAALDPLALWRFRDLAWVLAQRDLKVRYKQTLLGAGWAVIQPVATMCVLHLFFGQALGLANRVGDIPYPVFLYAGLLPWTLFASGVTAASAAITANSHIVAKVYFPRLLLPLSALLTPLVDYLIACVVLLVMMLYFGTPFTAALLLLPLFMLSTVIAMAGVGIAIASINVTYRDFRHVLPLLLQLGFFVTPVIYPVTLLPQRWQWLLPLNPMAGTVEAFRAVILNQPINAPAALVSTTVGLLFLVLGLITFANAERQFADVV